MKPLKAVVQFLKDTIFLPMVLFIGLIVSSTYIQPTESTESPPAPTIVDKILKAGEITLITQNNPQCYYIYRDQAMGFEYDLAKAFADYLGVKLRIKIADNWDGMLAQLSNQPGAFMAAGMTPSQKRLKNTSFSEGYMMIQQHIIVHRKNQWIKHFENLSGMAIHVSQGTAYQERIEALNHDEFNIAIRTIDHLSTEELIHQVAETKIEATIADSNIAFLSRRYYPQIHVSEPIGEEECLNWAVNRSDKALLFKINAFFRKIKKDDTLNRIYNTYYSDIDRFDYVDLRKFHQRIVSRLPKYQPLIQQAAGNYRFDWRLIAAQIYQESHFNLWAESHAGAYGLMQLTRPTAKSLGVINIINPKENIHAGVRHLRNLFDLYDRADKNDRLFIALAAYNVGQGHIRDAQRLAKSMDLDPYKWDSLSTVLPLLQKKQYYQNATYGYCRGSEPVQYIRQIMIYYDILKHKGIEYTKRSPVPQEEV